LIISGRKPPSPFQLQAAGVDPVQNVVEQASVITEAAEHYGQLIDANPAAFLPNLATSLNNLSTHRDAGESDAKSSDDDWQGAINALTDCAARAILRAAWIHLERAEVSRGVRRSRHPPIMSGKSVPRPPEA
jgi:hypothetical protein